jgi:hypothetical protein
VSGTVKPNPDRPQNKHLRPWKKGDIPNPKGSSKLARKRREFNEWVDELWSNAPQELVEALKNGVRSRKFDFTKEALARVFGNVPNKNELTGADGAPLQISISVVSDAAKKQIDQLEQ